MAEPGTPATKAFPKHPQDARGHFIQKDSLPSSSQDHTSSASLVDALIPHGISVDKKATDDTLLDVHLGNPLRRITKLLEEMKKEKAFSFSIKDSLGEAGIVLVLGTFGFLGGTRALCSKGTQSHIGMLKQLQEIDAVDQIPVISNALDAVSVMLGRGIEPKEAQRLF